MEGYPASLDLQGKTQIEYERLGTKYADFKLKIVLERHIICLIV